MASIDLNKIRIAKTAVGGRIVIARFGKDPTLSLDQRDAQSEFWQVLADYAFDGKLPEIGEGREISFGDGDEQFVMTIKRVAEGPA